MWRATPASLPPWVLRLSIYFWPAATETGARKKVDSASLAGGQGCTSEREIFGLSLNSVSVRSLSGVVQRVRRGLSLGRFGHLRRALARSNFWLEVGPPGLLKLVTPVSAPLALPRPVDLHRLHAEAAESLRQPVGRDGFAHPGSQLWALRGPLSFGRPGRLPTRARPRNKLRLRRTTHGRCARAETGSTRSGDCVRTYVLSRLGTHKSADPTKRPRSRG